MPGFFDEGFGRKVAGLVGGWDEGGVTPGGAGGRYAQQPGAAPLSPREASSESIRLGPRTVNYPSYGVEVDPFTFTREPAPYLGAVVGGQGVPGEQYGRPFDESGLPLSERVSFPYEGQFAAGSFSHVPSGQIPEDLLFSRPVLRTHNPQQLRAELRKQDDAALQRMLFARQMVSERSGQSAADQINAMRGQVDLDPAWSVMLQEYQKRLAPSQPPTLAALAPTTGGSSIVSPEMMARIRR